VSELNVRGPAAALGLLILSSTAAAQQLPPPPTTEGAIVRVRLGPFWLNPTVALSNAGIDTNVFNEADVDHPKRDFTLTVTPRSDVWLRMGRTWLGGIVKEDLVWYKKYASERATNDAYTIGWVAPLTRVSFGADASWVSSRDRAGYEIDARLQHTDLTYTANAELRALSKTFVGVKAVRRQIDYSSDASYRGLSLREELNRNETGGDVTVRYEVTPLTSLILQVGRQEDRFEFDPLRDSNSTRAAVGVNFDPFALIKGSARIGYRRFQPVTATVPGYDGSTAQVDLSYVALGSTKISVQALRDVQYSYDVIQPYYLQTGVSAAVTQQIAGPVDASARVVVQRLAYRDREDLIPEVSNRIDRVHMYGGSVGYRIGTDLRVAFNVDQQLRRSQLSTQRFDGLRYGMSVTYGF
jgi:hypothetical protein